MSFIEFKKIKKSFGTKVIYTDLSLEIKQGETITIIGGSGTGKSVMLKLLLRLLEPDAGEIFLDGTNLLELSLREVINIRKRFGMLFQGAALFDSMNVADNVSYPLREHFPQYSEEKYAEIVKAKLEVVGLPGIEEMMPSDLSGGMKKRVGLARAIATDPEVILYDEPTTGLDPTNTSRINELIISLQKKFQVTSIVVTHDMDSAMKVSDRLALLHDKKIAFVGSKEEVHQSDNETVRDFIEGKMGDTL